MDIDIDVQVEVDVDIPVKPFDFNFQHPYKISGNPCSSEVRTGKTTTERVKPLLLGAVCIAGLYSI